MAHLFKGYIRSRGKEPLSSVKTGTILENPPVDHDYVGVLFEDIIQLDFDDERSAETVMKIVAKYKYKCDILKTTRGVHLYFKNDGILKQSVGVYNAIGVKCDIGLGSKHRVVPLRITAEIPVIRIVNGEDVHGLSKEIKTRPWLQQYDDLDVLPEIFRPVMTNNPELALSNTRNQTLFNYILRLQTFGFTKDEVRKTIKVVNEFILHAPLTDREIDVITRDDAFSEELFYDSRGHFLHDVFGNYMLANSNIVKIDGMINIYTDMNLYSNDPNEFEKQMLHKIPSLKDAQRKEVYKYMSLRCHRIGEFANPRYLGLKTQIIDLENMDEHQYSPRWIINNKIEYDYKPTAYHKIMDNTLNKVCMNDPQIRKLLEEMIGYTLYRKNSMQVCFILTGEGSNGKSTILNVIKKLLGKANFCSLDLRELEETFTPANLYNKLANIGDDISSKFLESSSVFKKVVTGESFVVQRKYAQPFELESYATQIFCANEMPRVHDKSDGFSRRIVIIPFNAKFTRADSDYDPFIEDKLMSDEAVEYLLALGIEGLRRVLINKGFTKADASEVEKAEYMRSNNNALEWLESSPKIENESVNDVYLAYRIWCADAGCEPMKKLNLSRELKKHGGYESITKWIDGKSVRLFGRV